MSVEFSIHRPCLWLLLFFLSLPAPGVGAIDYVATAGAVSFDQVMALPAGTAASRFEYGEAPSQFAELWLPQAADRSPLVIFIHGGCWLNAYGIDHSRPLSTALAGAGYAVWSLEYRRVGDVGGGWPGSLADVEAGIRQLANTGAASLDLSRVVLMGHSAGGHLALLAGAAFAAAAPGEIDIRAVIGLAAITDIAAYAAGTGSCQSAAAKFIGATFAERPELYTLANPAKLPLHPRSLLLQGTADSIVPASQARAVDLPVEWIEGAGHFDLIHPGTPAWQQLLHTLERILQ